MEFWTEFRGSFEFTCLTWLGLKEGWMVVEFCLVVAEFACIFLEAHSLVGKGWTHKGIINQRVRILFEDRPPSFCKGVIIIARMLSAIVRGLENQRIGLRSRIWARVDTVIEYDFLVVRVF
jgi:hypothetical protein